MNVKKKFFIPSVADFTALMQFATPERRAILEQFRKKWQYNDVAASANWRTANTSNTHHAYVTFIFNDMMRVATITTCLNGVNRCVVAALMPFPALEWCHRNLREVRA